MEEFETWWREEIDKCLTPPTPERMARLAWEAALKSKFGGDKYESVTCHAAEEVLKRVINSASLPDLLALINVINALCVSPTENNIKVAQYAAERATLLLDMKELRRVWRNGRQQPLTSK